MTLQQLEYILAIDQLKHFGKAAEHCGVTQPTLSAMVHKLEEELNVKLFDRTSQPISPTAIGLAVIRQARYVLTQAEHIHELVAESMSSITGSFHLAVLPTIAPYLLPRFYPHFLKAYPELDVRMSEMKIDKIEQALILGELDAAIVATDSNKKELKSETIFYEEFLAYVSTKERLFKQKSIKTADITGERLWLLDDGHCFKDQLVKFCNLQQVKESRQAYNLGSMETFMRMVESGQGLTFIPQLALDQLNSCQRELIRPFAIPRPTRKIRLITRKDFVRNRLLSSLKESIQHAIPKEMQQLQSGQYLV